MPTPTGSSPSGSPPPRHPGHRRPPRRRGADLRWHVAQDGRARLSYGHSRPDARRDGHARICGRPRTRSGRSCTHPENHMARRARHSGRPRREHLGEQAESSSHAARAAPRVVILPYWKGRHPDHYTASTLGYEACFLSGLKKLDCSAAVPAPVVAGVRPPHRKRQALKIKRNSPSPVQDHLRHALLRHPPHVRSRYHRAVRGALPVAHGVQNAILRPGSRQRPLPRPKKSARASKRWRVFGMLGGVEYARTLPAEGSGPGGRFTGDSGQVDLNWLMADR